MPGHTFIIAPDTPGLGDRMDKFLATSLPDLSRSRLQALVKEGAVLLNGRATKPGHLLAAGDRIELTIPEDKPSHAQAEDLPLSILHEDDDLCVLNKASGMVVHPAAGNPDGTLVNALLHRFGALSSIGGVTRPGIVHRLDKETSGCLVVARNDFTHEGLTRQFAGRETTKIYLAVVQGVPPIKSDSIKTHLGRNPANRLQMAVVPENAGKYAHTDYQVICLTGGNSLVRCTLHTGRTHQIRVHLKHLGHPLLGDETYSRPARQTARVPRLMLHAWQLGFTHPRSNQLLHFTAPIPPEFEGFLPPGGL